MVLLIERYMCQPSMSAGSWSVGIPTGGIKLCPITGEHRRAWDWRTSCCQNCLGNLDNSCFTSTASHVLSSQRSKMNCCLRRILSKSKIQGTLLLRLVPVNAPIGWVSLGHEQRPSMHFLLTKPAIYSHLTFGHGFVLDPKFVIRAFSH
jgi:hypothetical protein